jgi:hypothetical protein
MHRCRFTTAVVVGLVSLVMSAPAAEASPPDRFVNADKETGSFAVDCGSFEASITSTFSDRFTFFFDSDGNVSRFTEFVSAPHDVWTNTTTGKSITVRGHFVQVAERIPGTNEFTRTVTGFRYLVNEPGKGAVIRDVGRIVYDNLEESSWRDLAGRHDLADGMLIEPTFCGALA